MFLLKVGERQTVLITEDAKDQAHFVGHNKYYDQVSYFRPYFVCLFVCKPAWPAFEGEGEGSLSAKRHIYIWL